MKSAIAAALTACAGLAACGPASRGGAGAANVSSNIVSTPATAPPVATGPTPAVAPSPPATSPAQLAALNNQYSDAVLKAPYIDLFPAALTSDRTNLANFTGRLQTVVPIELQGGYYFGTGCASHDCGFPGNNAAYAIDSQTGVAAVVIMITDWSSAPVGPSSGPPPPPPPTTFQVFGAQPNGLPPPLAGWAAQNGMTAANVRAVPPPS